MVNWTTFPERLEENDISWKVYQNELSVGVGFTGEEDSWLANFGDNPLEYFTQYNVKFHPAYIDNLPKAAAATAAGIKKTESGLQSLPAGAATTEIEKAKKTLDELKKQLADIEADQKKYTKENYLRLTAREKALHIKAFDTNIKDPNYHQLTNITYKDGDTERQMKAPKGDVLQQFREDVKNGSLPTVSWLVAPENFSDHPSAAWFGAWYISEVLDTLTQNPEVWKKTIFILTYDENDGYYDHVPPFVAPHPHKASTGSASTGINTGVDYVADNNQQSIKEQARESSIGLGYRVPMVIASPWSRGGWVNSEVFDHTSSIQFLEAFLTHKTGKKIEEPNISQWRRTVCGDLTSVFRPYNGEKITLPEFLERDAFIEGIHKAQFRQLPSNYKKLTADEIDAINKAPWAAPQMPQQEKGIRDACALPYELHADCKLSEDKKTIEIRLEAGLRIFGKQSAGSPFHIYAPGQYQQQTMANWAYAVAAGQHVKDKWQLSDFKNNTYHLQVYGPNGFFREFKGTTKDPNIEINVEYSGMVRSFPGDLEILVINDNTAPVVLEIIDNAYKAPVKSITVPGRPKILTLITIISTDKSFGWYDFSVKIKGNQQFEHRYAGRVETGNPTKTDPFMGRVV
jgi:phospholipase C